jgi:hypothetical protein
MLLPASNIEYALPQESSVVRLCEHLMELYSRPHDVLLLCCNCPASDDDELHG